MMTVDRIATKMIKTIVRKRTQDLTLTIETIKTTKMQQSRDQDTRIELSSLKTKTAVMRTTSRTPVNYNKVYVQQHNL